MARIEVEAALTSTNFPLSPRDKNRSLNEYVDTLVYNSLFDSVVILNSLESDAFRNQRYNDNDMKNELLALGILTTNCEFEDSLIRMQLLDTFLHRDGIPSITIHPTQACNAKCEYCFARHNMQIKMDKSTVEGTIEFFKMNYKRGDRVLLRWFGGEPLLGSDIIDGIIDGIADIHEGELFFDSLMFTNGALWTSELIDHAIKRWHLKKVTMPLDGYGEEHRKRKGYPVNIVDYYGKVLEDTEKLLSAGVAVDCRVNLDKKNISQLDDVLRDMRRFRENPSFRVRVTVLRPTEKDDGRFEYIKPEELRDAYKFILDKLFKHGLINDVVGLIPKRRSESCIAKSIDKIIIGADGGLYKCVQRSLCEQNRVGTVNTGIATYKAVLPDKWNTVRNECSECAYYPICLGGCDEYRKIMTHVNVTPCIREKYYMDLIFDYVYDYARGVLQV